jgi:hypothetical protein
VGICYTGIERLKMFLKICIDFAHVSETSGTMTSPRVWRSKKKEVGLPGSRSSEKGCVEVVL